MARIMNISQVWLMDGAAFYFTTGLIGGLIGGYESCLVTADYLGFVNAPVVVGLNVN